jgi:hypothetical protein
MLHAKACMQKGTLGVTALERSLAKQFATEGLSENKHIKQKKLIALQNQRGGYSMILPRPEHLDSNQQEHYHRDKRNKSSFQVL